MKITGAKINSFLTSPPNNLRAILVFGPDEGLVRERAVALAKLTIDDLSDPFRVCEMFGSDLKADPARLADEAQSLSFGGGERVVRVRQATDLVTEACKSYLEMDVPKGASVIIDAGDLSPRSKLRKLFEVAKNAACIPCYSDDARSLPDVVRESLKMHNLSIDRDALGLLTQSLGSDRAITRGELDKLALYMGDETQITEADVRASVGDNTANGVDDVIYAAASGDALRLETVLTRVLDDGTNPVQLVRAAQRHFHKLHLARGYIAGGMNADAATKAMRPPIMFKVARAFTAQLNLWPESALARAFEILSQAETDCKTTGYPAAALTSRALLSLAQAANHNRQRARY